jgi:WD40 repeat protein
MAESPYKGLMPYSEEDAAFFFGRESEQKIIIANLLAWRLTVLYGKSGVGKSSVLRAGVSHALQRSAVKSISESGKPEHVVVVFSSWRDDPLVGLKKRVEDSVCRTLSVDKIVDDLSSASLVETLKKCTKHIDGNLLIILDQFEDYFLYQRQDMHADSFAAEFPRAVNHLDLRVNFLISIREDALAKLDHFKGYIPNLFDNYLRIKHLNSTSARAAVEEPIEHYNRLQGESGRQVTIESELVDEVLQQVQAGRVRASDVASGVLETDIIHLPGEDKIETPYLQLVLVRLWNEEKREGSEVLRVKTLKRLGGAERIVQTHLDNVLTRLSDTEQETAARVFYHLVTPSGTKIAHSLSDLSDFADTDPEQLGQLLEKLAEPEIRILRPIASPPETVSSVRYEIFHDVLAAAILKWRTQYTQAREKAQTDKLIAKERRRVANLKWGVAGLSVLIILVLALSAYIIYQQESLIKEKEKVQDLLNTDMAKNTLSHVERRLVQGKKDDVTALLARQAYLFLKDTDNSAVLRDVTYALREVLDASNFCHTLPKQEDTNYFDLAISPDGNQLVTVSNSKNKAILLWDLNNLGSEPETVSAENMGVVLSAKFNPDGSILASAGTDFKIRLWNLKDLSASPMILEGHEKTVNAVAFSPDGSKLASASEDETIRLWDLKANDPGGTCKILEGHTDWVNSVAFSPDGLLLASASDDETIVLWDLEDPNHAHKVVKTYEGENGHNKEVREVAFSPDGFWLASASNDKTIRLWNLEANDPWATFESVKGHNDWVNSGAFGPDGFALASSGTDETVRLDSKVFNRHEDPVNSVAFSPDGSTLASASNDEKVLLYDLKSEDPNSAPVFLIGHNSCVNSIAFSSDGKTLVSVADDGMARIWPLDKPKTEWEFLKGDPGQIYTVTISPNWLASGGTNKKVRLWNLANLGSEPIEPIVFKGHEGHVKAVAFNPDETILASAGDDKKIHLWDLTRNNPAADPHILEGHKGAIFSLAFSPDGSILASASADKTIRLWVNPDHGSDPTVVKTLEGHKEVVSAVAFSPDGSKLASASYDKTIRLWHLKAKDPETNFEELTGHDDWVNSVAFSPDGNMLASAGDDNNIRLWDLTGAKPTDKRVFRGHQSAITSVAFHPDGKTLASASNDMTIRLWDLTEESSTSLILNKYNDPVRSVAFAPDGRFLAAASEEIERNIGIWIPTSVVLAETSVVLAEKVCERVRRNLNSEERQYFLKDENFRPICQK